MTEGTTVASRCIKYVTGGREVQQEINLTIKEDLVAGFFLTNRGLSLFRSTR